MKTKEEKYKNIILETYEILFKESTPSVSFEELCKNCKYEDQNGNLVETNGYLTDIELHEKGLRRVIPFMDYEIDKAKAIEILNNQIKKYKLDKFEQEGFKTQIWLGCSPKFKNENA